MAHIDAGKTTTTEKIAKRLTERQNKKVMIASLDVNRPAAQEQLAVLGQQTEVATLPIVEGQQPVDIAKRAMQAAKLQGVDVIMLDTAGRLAIDAAMMLEIRELHEILEPAETLFVVDSMTGQDAANTARIFGRALPLTGIVLTKADGDARGGAALSVRQVTGKPIKFLGVGEKIDALEAFHPQRIASRILGMGDMLSLIEQAEREVDRKKAERLARKVRKGRGFDLADMRDQFRQMHDMGGFSSILDKLPGPGIGALPPGAASMADDRLLRRMEAVIDSMTPRERSNPAILNGSRKRRILKGSGTSIQDLNRLLKQYKTMQKAMRKMKGRSMQQLISQISAGTG